jgi:cell division protein FtsB
MRCTCEAEVKRQTEALREENEKLKQQIALLKSDIARLTKSDPDYWG